MKLRIDADGGEYVHKYEKGDFVRLRTDERGEGGMGKAGQWGRIASLDTSSGATFCVQIAGYSEPKNSSIQRLVGISRTIVVPCNRYGDPIPLAAKRKLVTFASPAPAKSQFVVVNNDDALPAWAASLVVAGCTLLLVVATAVALKSFGVV